MSLTPLNAVPGHDKHSIIDVILLFRSAALDLHLPRRAPKPYLWQVSPGSAVYHRGMRHRVRFGSWRPPSATRLVRGDVSCPAWTPSSRTPRGEAAAPARSLRGE